MEESQDSFVVAQADLGLSYTFGPEFQTLNFLTHELRQPDEPPGFKILGPSKLLKLRHALTPELYP